MKQSDCNITPAADSFEKNIDAKNSARERYLKIHAALVSLVLRPFVKVLPARDSRVATAPE